jgi:hypothetical protein
VARALALDMPLQLQKGADEVTDADMQYIAKFVTPCPGQVES